MQLGRGLGGALEDAGLEPAGECCVRTLAAAYAQIAQGSRTVYVLAQSARGEPAPRRLGRRLGAAALALLLGACAVGSVTDGAVRGAVLGRSRLERCTQRPGPPGAPPACAVLEECQRIEGGALSEPLASALGAAVSGVLALWRGLWRFGAAE